MGSIWGEHLKISAFGESHGEGIGVVMDGLPAGVALDMDELRRQLSRRAPGKTPLSSPRKEEDAPEILSGIYQGTTTGAPLCALIRNTSQRSGDYDALAGKPRPGHADYTAHIKSRGFEDMRGGGHFSGRLTAALLLAGAVCMQALERQGITFGAHALEIGGMKDSAFDPVNINAAKLRELAQKPFPVLDEAAGARMKDSILAASEEGDSLGGIVECACIGLPAGIGEPMMHGLDSAIAGLVFAIPAVKGVSFGAGFEAARMKGSQNNDAYFMDGENIGTKTNNAGGVLGGISMGMPLIFSAAFKPTPSIGIPQQTVDLNTGEDCIISVKGRHDPCIVPRAISVVEGAAAIAVLDMLLLAGKYREG
jgi:chorismate synthase